MTGSMTNNAAAGAKLIAIDGPSGTGKSTVSREVARRLGAGYLDTGALYRIVTVHVLDQGVDPADSAAVVATLGSLGFDTPTDPDDQRHLLAGTDITTRIREADVTAAVSAVSAVPEVRASLLGRQREIAYSGPMVVEGRDIGTVIAPDAAVKIYLTADAEIRAARRAAQDSAEGTGNPQQSQQQVAADLARRDAADSGRAVAPLEAAVDAVVVDSTDLTIDETVLAVLDIATKKGVVIPGGNR